MCNFINIIYIIFLLKYSYSFRLKPNFNLSTIPTEISKRNFILNSELDDDARYGFNELKEKEFKKEGWLMELNEKNVEGVFDLIRKQFADDGGGIELIKIEGHVVYVNLTGSCVGCPFRSTTLTEVVQKNLRKFLKSPNDSPIRVQVVNDNELDS